MNYKFDSEEITVILVSLVTRRNNIVGLLNIESMPEAYYDGYRKELTVLDGMLERFFPGSVERIKATVAA